MIREGLGRCLRARGCQIIGEASNGGDALRQALRLRPHVVVVDGTLGDTAPFELARHLTAADRRQRVLMVACHDEPSAAALDDVVVRRAWDSGLRGIVEPA
jgi:DNA-binding NarL/FixJ family response regulator